LAGVALLLALGQQPGQAATIPVSAGCTLVDAITAANTDTAMGGCPAGSGADTIVLAAGSTQTLTAVNNTTYGPTGLPVISSVITIAGQGSTIVRDSGAPEFRLLAVHSIGDLTLQETTVSGGRAPIKVASSNSYYYGGGVANYGGTLKVVNSRIVGNVISGTYTNNRFGGGVANASGTLTLSGSTIAENSSGVATSGGTVTITNSTISDNRTTSIYGGAGGVVNSSGTVTITDSTISGNFAFSGGGGIVNRSGTVTITNSTITGNGSTQEDGPGGIFNDGGTVTIINSTISGNATTDADAGGGVGNVRGGLITITNSTIASNGATFADGGGVGNDSGTITITNSTITNNSTEMYNGGGIANSGGTVILARTLVSGNTASFGPEIVNDTRSGGTVLADNHNLFGVNGTAGVEDFTPGATDIVPPPGVLLPDILDPTLAHHGGPTQTHALVPGSPAIDAGGTDCSDATGAPLLADQRGKPRLVDGAGDGTAACDIGAFEFFPLINNFVTLAPDLDTAFDPTAVTGGPAGTFTITATFTNTSDTALRFPFFTVTELSGDNVVLNADEGTQGVGATVTPAGGDRVLAPGEAVTVDFVIGLHAREPFTFLVNLFGEPVR
jgi:hypothetical protein